MTAFKAVLRERRAQIDAHEGLPDLPGQALYVARIKHDERLQGSDRRHPIQDRTAQ